MGSGFGTSKWNNNFQPLGCFSVIKRRSKKHIFSSTSQGFGFGEFFHTPPKFNSKSPWKKGWLEDDPLLLGFGNFSGANP